MCDCISCNRFDCRHVTHLSEQRNAYLVEWCEVCARNTPNIVWRGLIDTSNRLPVRAFPLKCDRCGNGGNEWLRNQAVICNNCLLKYRIPT